MDHYDVIIIGTGAGGGTLAHRLAPTGKRILLLERGGYLPREPENWDSKEVFLKERYLSGEEWIDKDGNAFRPHQQYFVGGNTKFYGAILFRLRERDFGEVRHHGGRLAGVADRPTTTSSPTTPRPSGSTSSTASAARTRPRPRPPGRSPTRPSRTSRASSSSTTTSSATGHHPFHLPVGVDLDESDPEGGRCVRCDRFDGFPCLTDGKADAHVLLRAARAQAPERHAAHARARRCAWRPTLSGRSVTEVVVDRRGREERYSADVVVVSCGAVNSAALLLRSARDAPPARAGQLLRRGRPPLHGPHQLGRDRDLPGAEPHALPEDARRQRLLLGRRRLRLPARAHPDARQERQEHPARRRAVVRPGAARWTTWPSTRSTSG